MDYKSITFDSSRPFRYSLVSTLPPKGASKANAVRRLEENRKKIEELQDRLYAQNAQSLLVVLQAMDAGGKDSTIKHVYSGLNPQGIQVSDFKQPSTEEARHDFLWRIHKAAPMRGCITIFNRSHYEDVLIGRVENLPAEQGLAFAGRDIWKQRYRQIRDFERLLSENGTRILKVHLYLSKEEQNRRFLARLDNPGKNWKFSKDDLATRAKWDDYRQAYKQAILHTGTQYAPWVVVPADKKWYARAVVSDLTLAALRDMKPEYPRVGRAQREELAACRRMLDREKG